MGLAKSKPANGHYGVIPLLLKDARKVGVEAATLERNLWDGRWADGKDDEYLVFNIDVEGSKLITITMDSEAAGRAYIENRILESYEKAFMEALLKTYYLGVR